MRCRPCPEISISSRDALPLWRLLARPLLGELVDLLFRVRLPGAISESGLPVSQARTLIDIH